MFLCLTTPQICNLTRFNRAFHGAASLDLNLGGQAVAQLPVSTGSGPVGAPPKSLEGHFCAPLTAPALQQWPQGSAAG